jgi:hypothetical protein
MARRFIFLTVTSLLLISITSQLIARSLPDSFIRSTVFIHNKSTGATGTGFLVKRVVNKDGHYQLVLISNKHVLMPANIVNNVKDKKAEATISINITTGPGVSRRDFPIVLRTTEGLTLVKSHPKNVVDVAGIVLLPKVVFPSENTTDASQLNIIPEDRIMTKEMIKENFITIGDSLLVLGYPLNLIEAGHVTPIARGAVLATSPREDFRGVPAFLVDSTIVRGSSGSPVFIPMSSGKWVEEMKIDIFKIQQSHVIGVVAGMVKDWELVIRKEITFGASPQEIAVIDSANLGIVFRGDCIIDVLNELNIPKWDKPAE